MSKDSRRSSGGATREATSEQPFHYAACGLPNVFLVGISVHCSPDGEIADIPCLPDLLRAIGEAVASKDSPLVNEELRFLRKNMGVPAKTLAMAIDLEPETLSRYENGRSAIPGYLDKLIRLMYADLKDVSEVNARFALNPWVATHGQQRIVATFDGAAHHWSAVAA